MSRRFDPICTKQCRQGKKGDGSTAGVSLTAALKAGMGRLECITCMHALVV